MIFIRFLTATNGRHTGNPTDKSNGTGKGYIAWLEKALKWLEEVPEA
jgi:hypothetical protein